MTSSADRTDWADAAETLVDAGRSSVALGLSPGTSGNVSVRIGEHILVSPTGVSLGELTTESLSVLDLQGTHLEGNAPSKEFPLHVVMYAINPGANAVVHLHSPYAVAASCLAPQDGPSALPALTPYLVMKVGQVPLVPYAAPGSAELAKNLESTVPKFNAALLANHGSIMSAASAAAAVDAGVEVEEASRTAVLLHGRPVSTLGVADIRALTSKYGTPWDV